MAESKKRGCGFYVLCFLGLGFAINLVVLALNPHILTDPPSPTPSATEDPSVVNENLRLKSAVLAATAIKQAVNDPDSLVIESARTSEGGEIVCINYRSRNGFGGMVRSAVAFEGGQPRQTAKFWSRNCDKPLFDLTDRVARRI